MRDQAHNLRDIMARRKKEAPSPSDSPTRARTVAITSGKGGVGKSSLACNLAIALEARKRHTLLIDGDLGLANVDILLGINPRHTLKDLIAGTHTLTETVIDAPGGIQVLPGGSGIYELANLEDHKLVTFINCLDQLEQDTDYILIDTGAGLSRQNIGFLKAADQVIVLATPEPTSLADAYGVIKVLVTSGTDDSLNLVINRAGNESEAREVYESLNRLCRHFLKTRTSFLGWIPEDKKVTEAVRNQDPLLVAFPQAEAASAVEKIAARLVGENSEEQRGRGIKAFFYRLFGSSS